MFQAQVFTLYPEVFPGPLAKGLYGKALSNKLWNLSVINIRDAATDKHKTVDDTPYGGGTGMLLKADILANSLDRKVKKGERVFYLSPKGKKFDQKLAQDLSKEKSKSLNISEDEVLEKMKSLVPANRLGKIDEYGYLVSFLSSDKAAYINGASIPIDGGLLKSY